MYTHFRLVPKSITLDDLERINSRYRITSEMTDFQPLFAKNMSQTISRPNIQPRILLTINRKSTGSIDKLRIICQGSLYTHCCRASPLLQLGFLVISYSVVFVLTFCQLNSRICILLSTLRWYVIISSLWQDAYFQTPVAYVAACCKLLLLTVMFIIVWTKLLPRCFEIVP